MSMAAMAIPVSPCAPSSRKRVANSRSISSGATGCAAMSCSSPFTSNATGLSASAV
jgi:hypothetical protein